MRYQLLIVAAALALAAGCDRNDPARSPSTASSPPASGGTTTPQAQANTPSTPANTGQPSPQEKKEGANPVQGQVDPKNREQHRDFQQKGDAAGPTGPDTQPKSGG